MKNVPPIVSPEWLVGQLDRSEVAIADCRFTLADPNLGSQQYQHRHIPGAYYLHLDRDLSSPAAQHGGRHPLPDPESIAAKFVAMGIQLGKSHVIAYDDSKMAFAARLWWLLRYLGHDRVSLLQGGWSAWESGGYPTSDIIPGPKSGDFVPRPRSGWVVDIETVRGCQDRPEVVLIDSRDGSRYRGEQEPIDPIAGHIPGAVNVPWQEASDENGYFCPLGQQQQRWEAIAPNTELIVYCGSGVTACVNLLSLAVAGIDEAKLYPGGWSDWCSYLK